MNEPIRIGFVGAGNIVRTRHIPGLRAIPGVVFNGVCNSSELSSRRAVDEFGIKQFYPTWQELVHSDDIDAVWIGTWPCMHHPVTLEALKAGKHVFCQARMAMNINEAQEMLDATEQTDRVTMLCPPPFGMRGDLLMKKLIQEENVLGDIYTIHLQAMYGDFLNPTAPLHWRQRQELSGFNALTVGIYAEVVQRWFGGIRNLVTEAKTFIPERSNGETMKPVTRPDVVMVLSEMKSGALMRWEWSGLAQPSPVPTLEAYGSQGAIRYDFSTDEVFVSRKGGDWLKETIPAELENPWHVEQDFIDAIRTGKEIHPNFKDGLEYMIFTEVVFRSVETGARMDLAIFS